MERRLLRLTGDLRSEGVFVPPSEVVTAARAILLLGVEHRGDLRDAVQSCLVKETDHLPLFRESFDRHFPPSPPRLARRGKSGKGRPPSGEEGTAGRGKGEAGGRRQEEERERPSPPLSRGTAPGKGQPREKTENRLEAERPRSGEAQRRSRLRRLMKRPFRERWTAQEESLVSDALDEFTARLATKFGRRTERGKRGAPDIRKTLRRNLSWGGVPFLVLHRRRRVSKRELVVLIDISGSVRLAADLFLRALTVLRRRFSGIRVFAYTDRPVEVRGVDGPRSLFSLKEEIARDLPLHALSDHGEVFRRFNRDFPSAVRRRTVAVVIGDGRNNGFPPQEWELEKVARRASRLLWIAPERPALWGTGDSDLELYASVCDGAIAAPTPGDFAAAIRRLTGIPGAKRGRLARSGRSL